jgi:hypothetical protein
VRTGGSPIPFSATLTLPDAPPAATAAAWSTPGGFLRVIFDQRLRPGPIDPANWAVRLNNLTVHLTVAHQDTQTSVRVDGWTEIGPPSANLCDFTPPPNDVRNYRLVPAVPFANFPVTVFP